MYEMRTGTDPTGPGLAWHVIARGTNHALCGQPLNPTNTAQDTTDRHCLPCMKAFQQHMATSTT
ncbi:hypothetical protein ACFV6E_04060 [Streptomyces sp. NPDC059785]|uniref:hypothetical protein n=1 Tax=Streptomyces sp. NPDC059785 TaxID=3346945 RepID=UPI00366242DC